MRYGLIGNPLGHSWSPRIHALLGDYDYRAYPLEENEIAAFLAEKDLGGLNVTRPYKKTVIPYCAEISGAAREIGSVNTLCFTNRGIVGYNTDCDGFFAMAKRAGIDFKDKKVVILGTGGTMLTARYCAKSAGAREIVVVSRSGEDNYENIARHRDADILVNTTPVGMFPDNGRAALSLDVFDRLCGVIDVIYNPMRTALVQDAMRRGIPATGGLFMLVGQAIVASEHFLNVKYDADTINRVFRAVESDVENIVLIGMPGCGKSSVGRELAAISGREFIDLDDEIAKAAKMPVPDIINRFGEAHFRALEAEAAAQAGKKSGVVIACGGGTPLFEENRRALSQNGRLILLERDRNLLPMTGGRCRSIWRRSKRRACPCISPRRTTASKTIFPPATPRKKSWRCTRHENSRHQRPEPEHARHPRARALREPKLRRAAFPHRRPLQKARRRGRVFPVQS